jgi:hypothetical protein
MSSDSVERLLNRLEQHKSRFGPGDGKLIENLLRRIALKRLPDADSLIRLHELLLFLRAHPHNPRVLHLAEQLLSSFAERVTELHDKGADLYALDYIENSGLPATTLSGTFSYGIVSWLVKRHPESVDIDWDRYEKAERMGSTLPRFLPLLDEDSLVEANIPYRDWLRSATGGNQPDLPWLIRRFHEMPVSEKERAEHYDSLTLPVRWDLGLTSDSRTNLRRRVQEVYYHRGRFLRRSDISLPEQFHEAPLPVTRLSAVDGEEILDTVRAATTVRYRELYGITHGDRNSVVKAEVGRGVEMFLWGLPVPSRLPLRGYHAGFTLKNGVPVNYIEAITLFERTEVGFNTFYTFRDGESAWIYAQALRLLNQQLRVTCISVDPYQVGFNNDEAIDSGAFWFYRKLGFRPTRAEIATLAEAEERKMRARSGYRTPARTLRKLARGSMAYEIPGSSSGDWDRFHIRNLGLAVQRRMAVHFEGDAGRLRRATAENVGSDLGLIPDRWKPVGLRSFENLALVLALIPDLSDWSVEERRDLARIVQAKTGKDESRYLWLLQRHTRLRSAIIGLGSEP